MRYGILIKDITKEDGDKYSISSAIGYKSGELFSFETYLAFHDGMVGFAGASIGAIPMEFAVEISESEYNRIEKLQKPTPEYTMAEAIEKMGHNFKIKGES